MVSYDNQNRLQRQHPMDGPNDYISQPPPPVQSSSSSSPLYQQNYGSSRNVTLPDSQQNTRRSNSYNMPQRQMHNESDIQND
ncbi:unnamed protein product, partial [Rotaria magnacalcarata]